MSKQSIKILFVGFFLHSISVSPIVLKISNIYFHVPQIKIIPKGGKLKKSLLIFAAVLGLFIFSQSAHAQNQNFSMTNNTGMILVDVFISPSASDNWGSDVIPKDMILDGETFDFTFTGVDPEHCSWDILFTADDGNKYYMRGVDLCSITSITLSK